MNIFNDLFKLLNVKTLALALALTLSGLLSCSPAQVTPVIITPSERDEIQEYHRELNLSTVLVQAESGTGSGVVFGYNFVLTAAHVVSHEEAKRDSDGNLMRNPDGSLIMLDPAIENASVFKNEGIIPFATDAKVVKIDYQLDLAILKLARPWPYTVARFAKRSPELYQKVWVAGHPHGVTDTQIAEGRIQDLWDEGFIRYSAPTTFGNSGGPVFLREDGVFKVTSIVQRVHVEGMRVAVTHLGMGALPDKVRDFVRDYVSGE